MPQLLISVMDVPEAQLALQHGADIIDLKDPTRGALGALPINTIQAVIDAVDGKKPVSATIGDVAMQPALLHTRMLDFQGLPLNYIKIGFFASEDYLPCLEALKPFAAHQNLIAVLFAECDYPQYLLPAIERAGFAGVMLDTMHKNGATYMDYYSDAEMVAFAAQAAAANLIIGIAGSLSLGHVQKTRRLSPDFMGFRGGVCAQNQRTFALDSGKICAVHNALQ